MSERNLFWLLGVAATMILGLAVAVFSAPAGDRGKDYENVRLLVDVLHEAHDKYVTEINPERERKLVEDMINGGLEHLDPHSTYINPKEWKQFNDHSRGKFGGIGVQVGYDRQVRTHVAYTPKADGKWTRHSSSYGQERLSVISCMPDTPASKAGVVSGDVILKIAGKSTLNMPSNEAVDLIKGEPGQTLAMTILHPGAKKPVDVTITRDIIEVKTVLGDLRKKDNSKEWDYFLPGDRRIGYVRLTGFGEESTREMLAALKELKDGGMRGLIFDLRNNPGGLLSEAVSVSNLFLPPGSKIVSTKGRNRRDESYAAEDEQRLLDNVFRRPDDAEMKAKVQGRAAVAGGAISGGRPGESLQRQCGRDRVGGVARSSAGRRRRRAQFRQGKCPGYDQDGKWDESAQADDGQLLAPQRQEHSSLADEQRQRRMGREAKRRLRSRSQGQRTARLSDRPQRARYLPRGQPGGCRREAEERVQGPRLGQSRRIPQK